MTTEQWIDKFISYLTPGHVEGLILFGISSIIMTIIHLVFKKEWTAGLKGANGLWEGPEILSYLCFWIFPIMIFSSGFLQVNYPEWAWVLIMGFMLFGLTGRWGLEWLLAFKNNATQVTSYIKEKEITKTETKDAI